MYELREHQVKMRDAAVERQRVIFEASPGVGKTLTALSFLESLGPSIKALILCPRSIVKAAWLGDHDKFGIIFHLESGTGNPRKRREARERLERGDVQAVVMNYESFLRDHKNWVGVVDVLVLDELTKIKNPTAKITKAVFRIADKADYVVGMTGCMHPNGLLDGWSQCRAISDKIYGTIYHMWRSRYFFQPSAKHPWMWKPYQGTKAKLEEMRAPWCIKINKEDCLDLPDQTYLQRDVDLSKDEAALYREFMETLVLNLKSGDVIATNALVEIMKARQILAGVVKVEDQWEIVGKSKLEEVKAVLQEINGPAMIVCGFRAEVERYASELGSEACILYGGMSELDRDRSIVDFQAGRKRYMVCHPASMAHGLTFVQCSDIIWATLSYDYEHFFQTNQRIHRIGQTKKCTYHLLNAVLPGGKRTIDKGVIQALLNKKEVSLSDIPEIAVT